jgi:alcohol dehydrogenase class IV
MRLVLAPTTSGSGSEATHFAVVYIGENKFSIAGPGLLPDEVILDPVLTLSASAYQRATSGIDALAQAVESRWAVGATAQSRAFADQAMPVLVEALPRFVHEPNSASAYDMAMGSHLAGRAIDISKTTAAHALAYGITKGYGVSHGHAVALSLGEFIKAHGDAADEQLQAAVSPADHRAALESICRSFGVDSTADAAKAFHNLAESIGLTMDLTQVGITSESELSQLTLGVNLERLGNNPVNFRDSAELKHVILRE